MSVHGRTSEPAWAAVPPITRSERAWATVSGLCRYLCCSQQCLRDHCTPVPNVGELGRRQPESATGVLSSLAMQRLRKEAGLAAAGLSLEPADGHAIRATLRAEAAAV